MTGIHFYEHFEIIIVCVLSSSSSSGSRTWKARCSILFRGTHRSCKIARRIRSARCWLHDKNRSHRLYDSSSLANIRPSSALSITCLAEADSMIGEWRLWRLSFFIGLLHLYVRAYMASTVPPDVLQSEVLFWSVQSTMTLNPILVLTAHAIARQIDR